MEEIEAHIRQETELFYSGRHSTTGVLRVIKETFTVKSNLRRVQQAIILFATPQLSGANSLTSYLVSILKIINGPHSGGTAHNIFISGMYALSKLCFSLLASFLFVDALGRRRSLFIGATIQMITDIYVGVYIKTEQDTGGTVSSAASQAAVAMIFIHAFGWAIETAGLTLEEVEDLFTGPWLQVARKRQPLVAGIDGQEVTGSDGGELERRETMAKKPQVALE
ncbi:hypothetical protein PRZ48_011260 [Zasmidium cellare]|uniref:Uncharacterized protein n=1 Tax=Zasmidium cellare TaxID=395010 RepID=A0ABR0EAV7_ZASCE|nr:hypothetical protein PRZ48_011260 [Zasmidium cellare]